MNRFVVVCLDGERQGGEPGLLLCGELLPRVEVPESLVPCLDSAGEPESLATRLADSGQDIVCQVGQQESHAVLLRLMAELPTRTQAIHKTAAAALEKLRTQLASLGFARLDSEELLKSATG